MFLMCVMGGVAGEYKQAWRREIGSAKSYKTHCSAKTGALYDNEMALEWRRRGENGGLRCGGGYGVAAATALGGVALWHVGENVRRDR